MKININDHPEFSKWLKAGLHEAVGKALLSTATRIVSTIQSKTIPETLPHQPVDRGTFRAGFRVEVGPRAVFIINNVPHAAHIEYGVRPGNVKPGRAMLIALAGWVKRKGLLSGHGKQGANAEAKSIAWAIAKNMQKKGIFGGNKPPSGLRVVQRAMLKFDVFFNEEFQRALRGATR